MQTPTLLCLQIETDEYEYNFTTTERPHVQNDTVTLHKRFAQVLRARTSEQTLLVFAGSLAVLQARLLHTRAARSP